MNEGGAGVLAAGGPTRSLSIAIVGGGNGAYAAAADLAEQGHDVRLWRRSASRLGPLLENHTLTLRDAAGTREVALARVGRDMGQVIDGAEIVIVPLPAPAQRAVALELAAHLRDGQVVFAPPGSLGSYVMAHVARQSGCEADVAFAEAGTLPYLARKQSDAAVSVTARATRLPTGVFPARETARVLGLLRVAFPAIEPRQDALDAALTNAGPIIHPPLVLLNAGPIEHFGTWDIHNEGTQPAIRRVQDSLDAERLGLREALGYPGPHFPLRDHYSSSGEEWMYGNLAHERLVESSQWRESLDLLSHRYMREDIAYGLALLVSVADWLGMEVPVARGLLSVASAITATDLRSSGRTLDNLGLAGLDPPALKRLFAEGLPDHARQ